MDYSETLQAQMKSQRPKLCFLCIFFLSLPFSTVFFYLVFTVTSPYLLPHSPSPLTPHWIPAKANISKRQFNTISIIHHTVGFPLPETYIFAKLRGDFYIQQIDQACLSFHSKWRNVLAALCKPPLCTRQTFSPTFLSEVFDVTNLV